MTTVVNPLLKPGDRVNADISRYNLHKPYKKAIRTSNVNEIVENLISQVHRSSLPNIESEFIRVTNEFCSPKNLILNKDGTYKYKDKVMTQAEYYLVIQKFKI